MSPSIEKDHTNVALIVHSCDKYKFLYPGFEYFFNANWDFNIPCSYKFITENLNVNIQGFENIQSGSGEWSDRLARILKEQIKEDYVLYFQEDMWLNKPISAAFFSELFKMAQEKNWLQVKIHSSPVYKTEDSGEFIEGLSIAVLDNVASSYLMSHQVTLWNKDFLIAQLLKNEHPWRNERKGTKRLRKINPSIIHLDYFAESGNQPINQNPDNTKRSEYHAVSFNSTLHPNVDPFIQILKKGDETARRYAIELEDHYNNQLTHDGRSKPKKEDLFKKIKNWVKKIKKILPEINW